MLLVHLCLDCNLSLMWKEFSISEYSTNLRFMEHFNFEILQFRNAQFNKEWILCNQIVKCAFCVYLYVAT